MAAQTVAMAAKKKGSSLRAASKPKPAARPRRDKSKDLSFWEQPPTPIPPSFSADLSASLQADLEQLSAACTLAAQANPNEPTFLALARLLKVVSIATDENTPEEIEAPFIAWMRRVASSAASLLQAHGRDVQISRPDGARILSDIVSEGLRDGWTVRELAIRFVVAVDSTPALKSQTTLPAGFNFPTVDASSLAPPLRQAVEKVAQAIGKALRGRAKAGPIAYSGDPEPVVKKGLSALGMADNKANGLFAFEDQRVKRRKGSNGSN